MNIDIPDALAMQGMALDGLQDSVALGDSRGRQILEQFQDRRPLVQTFTRNFAGHKRMHHDARSLQQVDKSWIASAKVINPHRRVDQNQTGLP